MKISLRTTMRHSRQRFVTLRRDEEGATIIEFAIVAPVFFVLMLGVIEFGLIGFHQMALDSAVAATARQASLGISGSAPDRATYVRQEIASKMTGLINSSQLTVAANVVSAGGVPGSPDICLEDANLPRVGGPCPVGAPFQDVNGNGVYDGAVPPLSLGNAGDTVELVAYLPWRVTIPFMRDFFGSNGTLMLSAATVVRNEPF